MAYTSTITRSNGFSLVEALVTGSLITIVSLIILPIMSFFYSHMNQSTTLIKLQIDYDIVAWQIGDMTRTCSYVLGPAETSSSIASYDTIRTTEIHLVTSSQEIAAYRIMEGKLQELLKGTWCDFHTGGHTVLLGSNSSFFLARSRRAVTIDLQIKYNFKSYTDSLSNIGGTFLCRN